MLRRSVWPSNVLLLSRSKPLVKKLSELASPLLRLASAPAKLASEHWRVINHSASIAQLLPRVHVDNDLVPVPSTASGTSPTTTSTRMSTATTASTTTTG